MKSRHGKSQRREEKKKEDQKEKVSEERRSRCAKRRKVAKHCVFPMICGSGGSKSRLAKAAGAEPCGQMRDEKLHVLVARSSSGALLEVEMSKKCMPLWREAHFQVKMYKAPQLRSAFKSWNVEKVHAVVARSTFRSENVQNTPRSDHFWTFRSRFAWHAQVQNVRFL